MVKKIIFKEKCETVIKRNQKIRITIILIIIIMIIITLVLYRYFRSFKEHDGMAVGKTLRETINFYKK